jgi:hypothetical protein
MNETNDRLNPAMFAPLRRYVPLAVWVIVVLTLLLVPLKIISYGYLPGDDALRHAAKAVSGKSWSEIMVLNQVYQIDHEFGWNLLLEKIHTGFNADVETLVIFSVVSLFMLVGLAALPWLRYPETWLAALTLSMITEMLPFRFLLGRPYLITLAAVVSVLLLWRRFGSAPPKMWMAALMTGLVTASVYLHGTWYLWALPGAAFFLAGQFRWCFTLGGCTAAGVFIGSALTGHLIAYPVQAVKLALLCVGAHDTTRTMATELQPDSGDTHALVILAGLLLLRRLAGLKAPPFLRDPAFWLVCLGWTLDLKIGRFWLDWGWPALLVLVACDLQLLLASRLALDSFRRLAFAAGMALITFLAITSDAGSRWTSNLTQQYLSEAEHPRLAGWMPEKGGLFYSADASLFFQTFYKNPHGDWQYMLGFEPTWMPREDFQVYESVRWNYGDAKAYTPWVIKMRPADRLAIRGGRANVPNIPQLEWNYGVSDIWIGRLPDHREGGAPATIRATATMDSLTNPASSAQ